MENYDRVNELIDVTKDATGRADEQFAKYADTVEYKTKLILNNWELFRTTLFLSEDYKKILDLVNLVLERVTKFKLPDVAAIGIWALTVGKTVATNIVESLLKTLNSSKTIISRHIERSILGTDTDLTSEKKEEIRKKAVDAKKAYQEAAKKASAAEGKIADAYEPRALAEKDLDYAEYLDKTIENLEEQYQKRMPDAKTAMSFTGIDEVADGIKNVLERTKAARAELGSMEELERKAITTLEEYNKAIEEWDKAEEQATEAEKEYELAQEERKKIAKAERWSGTVLALGQTVGNSLATAITMAFTGAFSGKEIAVTMSTLILGTAMPMFMSSITGALAEAGKEGGKTFWESFRGSGGWVTVALTILAFIGTKVIPFIADRIEESNEKAKRAANSVYNILKLIEELEEVQEKYNLELDEANLKYDEAKTKWDSIEDAKDTYEELSSKIILSEEETENLLSATATLAEQCPELIDHYDSMGNAVLKIGSAFDEVIEKQLKLYLEAELNLRVATLNANTVAIELKRLERDELLARIQLNQSMYEDLVAGRYLNGNYLDYTPLDREERIKDLLTNYESLQRSQTVVRFWDDYWIETIKDLTEKNSEAKRRFAEIVLEVTGKEANETLDFDALDKIIRTSNTNSQTRGTIYLKFLNEIFDSNGEYQERLDELNLQLDKTSIELQALINELKQLALDLAESQWEYAGILDDVDDKIRPAIKNALSHSFLTEDVVNKLYEEARKENTTKDEKGNLVLNEEAMISSFRASISLIINGEGLDLVNAYAAATPKMQAAIIDFYDTLGQVTLEESLRYIELVGGTSSQIGLDLQTALEENRKEIENYEFKLAKFLGETEEHEVVITNAAYGYDWLDSTGQIHSERGTHTSTETREQITDSFKSSKLFQYFDSLGSEQAEAFYNSFANMPASDIQRQIFLDNFEDFIGDLTEEQQKMIPQLMGIDWSSISLMGLTEAKDSFALWYQELGGTIEEAETKWEEYYEIAKESGLISFSTLFDADAYVEEWTSKLDSQTSAVSNLKTAITDLLTDGFINFTDSKNVEKACEEFGLKISDYISYDENGLMLLNTEKLRDALANSEDSYAKNVEIAKLELVTQKEKLKAELSELNSLQNGNTEADVRLLKETAITDAVLTRLQAEAVANKDTKLNEKLTNFWNNRKEGLEQAIEVKVDADTIEDSRTAIKNEIAYLEEQIATFDDEDYIGFKMHQSFAAFLEVLSSYDESVESAATSTEDLTDKLEDLEKAAETLDEKLETLNGTLYGTSYHKSKNDGLYNYQMQIDDTSRAIDRLLDKLANLSDGDNPIDLTNSLLGEFKNLKANYLAENRVIDQYLDNQLAVLQTKLASALQKAYAESDYEFSINPMDYFTISDSGKLMYDYDKINAAQMSDNIKDYLEEIASDREKQINAREDNIDKITKLEQDAEKMRKDAINSLVSLEDEVTKVLEDKYKKLIDDVKNKYSAMKDADDEYVDALSEAIEKQRRLRDEENSWNDLANKERKLALMQRDTSGGNRAEIKSLENEVLEDREKLLDDTVDNIIDGLKEMYETQLEARDAEIEYMEAMLENANLVEAANLIISSWSSEGDAVAWFSANVEDFEKKSEAYKLKEELNWKDLYNAASLYNTLVLDDIETALEVTEADIMSVITNTAEHLTTEPTREMDEFTAKLTEDIKKAKEAYDEAYKDWEEKNKVYLEALGNTGNSPDGDKGSDDDKGAGSPSPSSSEDKTSNLLTKVKSYMQSLINKVTDYPTNKGGELAEYERGQGELKNTSLEKYWEKISGFSFVELIRRYNMGWFKGFSLHINGSVDKDKLKALFNSKGILAQYEENPAGTTIYFGNTRRTNLKAFKAGGLVDFTGPAWVDGTKSKPEAFLNPEDTERIGRAAKLLSELPFLNSNNWSSGDITTTNVGDTTIEIHINIENVSSDYDVDQAVERVKQDIVDAANYAGRNVILKKS